jgi:hypothetical protein
MMVFGANELQKDYLTKDVREKYENFKLNFNIKKLPKNSIKSLVYYKELLEKIDSNIITERKFYQNIIDEISGESDTKKYCRSLDIIKKEYENLEKFIKSNEYNNMLNILSKDDKSSVKGQFIPQVEELSNLFIPELKKYILELKDRTKNIDEKIDKIFRKITKKYLKIVFPSVIIVMLLYLATPDHMWN